MKRPSLLQKWRRLQDALRDHRLTRLDQTVFGMILDSSNAKHGGAWPSQETLANAAGVNSSRNIRRAIGRLQSCGYLSSRRRGRGNTNLYSPIFHADDTPNLAGQTPDDRTQASAHNDALIGRTRPPRPDAGVLSRPDASVLQNPLKRTRLRNPPNGAAVADLNQAVEIWNAEAGDVLPRIAKLHDARRAALRKRLADDFGGSLEQWQAYCQRILASPFLCGENDRGWRADFDWALKPANAVKVLEGKYEPRGRDRPAPAQARPDLRDRMNELEKIGNEP